MEKISSNYIPKYYPGRLADIRGDAEIGTIGMAEILGIDRATYYRYETGQLSMPTHILCKFADHFGCSLDYVMGRSHDREISNPVDVKQMKFNDEIFVTDRLMAAEHRKKILEEKAKEKESERNTEKQYGK